MWTDLNTESETYQLIQRAMQGLRQANSLGQVAVEKYVTDHI